MEPVRLFGLIRCGEGVDDVDELDCMIIDEEEDVELFELSGGGGDGDVALFRLPLPKTPRIAVEELPRN